jgi:hypothetical protein
VNKSFASRRAIDIVALLFDPPPAVMVETTILSRPEDCRIEYGFVDRCAAGGGDSMVERICKKHIHRCESTVKPKKKKDCRAKVGSYHPSATRVTLEIELWASGKGMMTDGDGVPINVQLSIFQLCCIDAEAPNVAGDD